MMMARLDPCLIFLIVACIRVYGIERNTMEKIKFRAYVYDLTDEDSHPLEIDLRAGKLWDVTSINFKDRIVEIMDDDGNTWEYELNDEIALLQYTGIKDINGAEIYNGYIVRSFSGYETSKGDWVDTTLEEPCGIVVFESGSFYVKYSDDKKILLSIAEVKEAAAEIIEPFVVVGNIYNDEKILNDALDF